MRSALGCVSITTMRIGILPALGLVLLAGGCAGDASVAIAPPPRPPAVATASSAMSEADVTREVASLRAALQREVPQHGIDSAEGDRTWIVRAKAAVDAAMVTVDRAQLLVVVDRSPGVQQLRIVLARPDGPWEV